MCGRYQKPQWKVWNMLLRRFRMDTQHDPLLSANLPNQKFGEVYCNYMGVLLFHCTLCPQRMHHDEFMVHYMIHFRDLFEIKQEVPEDLNPFESKVGFEESESFPSLEEIKLEMPPQPVGSDASDTKSELRNSEDSCSSAEHWLEEDDTPRRKKRGRPKNSVKFTQPKECGICGESFVLRKPFIEHIRIHQCGKPPMNYECDVCGRKATKLKNLIDHFRYKHTRKIECEICNKMIRKNYRKAHLKRHKNERNFKCDLCDKTFVLAGDLTTHLKLHYSVAPIKNPSLKKFVEPKTCNVCGQKFIGISAYERHIQSHGTTSSLYECDICGRQVKEKKNLLSHMIFRHSGQPKLKAPCTICGKIFNRKYLNLHVRKHNVTNQNPSHICPICGKTFLVSSDLSAHIRQHNRTAEASPCSICGKTFASPASLADHNRVHSGER